MNTNAFYKSEPSAPTLSEASNVNPPQALRVHHGAIDQKTVTSRSPPDIMKRVLQALESMGIQIQEDCAHKFRCVRPKASEPLIAATGPVSVFATQLHGWETDGCSVREDYGK